MIYPLFLAICFLAYSAWEYWGGVKEYGSWTWFFDKPGEEPMVPYSGAQGLLNHRKDFVPMGAQGVDKSTQGAQGVQGIRGS